MSACWSKLNRDAEVKGGLVSGSVSSLIYEWVGQRVGRLANNVLYEWVITHTSQRQTKRMCPLITRHQRSESKAGVEHRFLPFLTQFLRILALYGP